MECFSSAEAGTGPTATKLKGQQGKNHPEQEKSWKKLSSLPGLPRPLTAQGISIHPITLLHFGGSGTYTHSIIREVIPCQESAPGFSGLPGGEQQPQGCSGLEVIPSFIKTEFCLYQTGLWGTASSEARGDTKGILQPEFWSGQDFGGF